MRFFLFTFQYGEIKSGWRQPHRYGANRFTFQYGEIKSLRPMRTTNRPLTHLHSSMERLKAPSLSPGGQALPIYIPVWRD